MNSITTQSAAATFQLPSALPLRGGVETQPAGNAASSGSPHGGKGTEALREQFTQFVGETFFGQMIKAMRSTAGKPAYFHGGRAEEVFQGQLDQKLAEHLTETSAERFAEPMFERQFSRFVQKNDQSNLNQLTQLRRY